MSLETGPALIFPDLNNSYLSVDPALMSMDEGLDYAHEMKQLLVKKYDLIIIGDSFTETKNGLANEICRQGNYSAIIFHGTHYSDFYNLILVENLISSGFLNQAKPDCVLLESAGRQDPFRFYHNTVSLKDRIAYDIPSLDLWLQYGSDTRNIISGLKSNQTKNLLDLHWESDMSTHMNKQGRLNITRHFGEPALIENLSRREMVIVILKYFHTL